LQAEFLERYFENGKEVRSEAGLAYFAKPGRMRWEYESPERNLFVIDGKWSWFYVPGDHTVTRVRARDSSDWRSPLALLAGEAKVSRVCGRVDPAPSIAPADPRGAVFRCLLRSVGKDDPSNTNSPLSVSAADSVFFEINSENGVLVRVLIRDPGGVEIEFRFADWHFDPPLEAAKFHFDPPRGVAIVDGELAASSSKQGAASRSEYRESRPQ
jgi:outer membrane lipoprotein carrier protein